MTHDPQRSTIEVGFLCGSVCAIAVEMLAEEFPSGLLCSEYSEGQEQAVEEAGEYAHALDRRWTGDDGTGEANVLEHRDELIPRDGVATRPVASIEQQSSALIAK